MQWLWNAREFEQFGGWMLRVFGAYALGSTYRDLGGDHSRRDRLVVDVDPVGQLEPDDETTHRADTQDAATASHERGDGDAVVFGLGNLLTNQPGDEANPCSSCPPETQDGLIAWFQISDEPGLGVRIIDTGYTPTWVNRTETHEVVPIGVDDPDQVDPMVLAGSAARTAAMVEPDLRLLDFTAG